MVTDVTTGQACTAPCSLQLPPGPRQIRIGGPDVLPQEVTIPPTGGSFTVGESNSGLDFATNATLVLGGAGAILGFIVLIVGVAEEPSPADSDESSYEADKDSSETMILVGGGMLIPSAVLLLTSLFLSVANDPGTVTTASNNAWVPRIGGGAVDGNGFVGQATWSF